MKALSIRAPWWRFILHEGKDIENRDWPTNFRGPVLIHASKWFGKAEVAHDIECACRLTRPFIPLDVQKIKLFGGHIVGKARIIDCVTDSDSPWFVGKYGFVLADPEPLECPIPFKGKLGFFEVSDEVLQGDYPYPSEPEPKRAALPLFGGF